MSRLASRAAADARLSYSFFALAQAVFLLQIAGRAAKVGRRPADIMDIALKCGACELLRLRQDGFFAACGHIPPLMERK